MSPIPKTVPLLTSFLPPASILRLCSPLSQNSLKELSILTVSYSSPLFLSQTQSSQLWPPSFPQKCVSKPPMAFMLPNPRGQLSVLIFFDASVAFGLTSNPSSSIHFFTHLPGHHALWFYCYPTGFFIWGSVAFPPSLPDLFIFSLIILGHDIHTKCRVHSVRVLQM